MGLTDISNSSVKGTIYDSSNYTIMSYNRDGSAWVVQTPMIGDIQAVIKEYDANTTTRTGSDHYGFNPSFSGSYSSIYDFNINKTPHFTIYDAGGQDTLDASGFKDRQYIDLTPGHSSWIGDNRPSYFATAGSGNGNVWIYDTTMIENAIGGNGDDELIGNAVANELRGNGGNDFFKGLGGADIIDGGFGVDTAAYLGSVSTYTIFQNVQTGQVPSTIFVNGGSDGGDTLNNIEQIKFSDYTLVFDKHSGKDLIVYEIYQAAFGRIPDNAGFRAWSDYATSANVSATQLADCFLYSNEFISLYGTNTSNASFVKDLYANVLGRAPDQSGFDAWVNAANSGMPSGSAPCGLRDKHRKRYSYRIAYIEWVLDNLST